MARQSLGDHCRLVGGNGGPWWCGGCVQFAAGMVCWFFFDFLFAFHRLPPCGHVSPLLASVHIGRSDWRGPAGGPIVHMTDFKRAGRQSSHRRRSARASDLSVGLVPSSSQSRRLSGAENNERDQHREQISQVSI